MEKRVNKHRPQDFNQLACSILAVATEEAHTERDRVTKNPHASALGKLGGKRGGTARAANLSAEQRKTIAQKAAKARWGN